MKHNTTYTARTDEKGVHVSRITPVDPELVRFSLTSHVRGFSSSLDGPLLDLYAALLMTGTKRRSKEALEDYLKRYGITISVQSSHGSITWSGNVRKANIAHLVGLLRELVSEPALSQNEYKEKRSLALEHVRELRDDAKLAASTSFFNVLYPSTSYLAHPTLDEEYAVLSATRRQKLVALTDDILHGVWYLSIVCDEETLTRMRPLVRHLTSTASSCSRALTPEVTHGAIGNYITVPGKTNIEVRLGAGLALTSDDPAYTPFDFGIDVLGKVGGFTGRLMSTVREKEGLTYGIYAHTEMAHKGNMTHWNIRTFFSAKDYEKGIASTKREIRLIREKGITNDELLTMKEILKNAHILGHDSNRARLHLYHGLAVLGYTEQDYKENERAIAALTIDAVNAALGTHLDPDRLILSAAGPIKTDGTPITTAH